MFNNASSRHSQPPSLPSPSLGTRRFRTIVLFDDYNTHPDYHYMADIDSHRTKTNEMLQRNAEFWSGLRYLPLLQIHDVGSASDYSPSTPPEQAASLDEGNLSGSDSNHHHPMHSGKPGAANSSLRRRRGNLPKNVTAFLRNWLVQHKKHPYPTEDEKIELARRTSLTVNQISNWFINARRRILQPILRNEQMHAAVAKKEHVNMHDFDDGTPFDYGKRKSATTTNTTTAMRRLPHRSPRTTRDTYRRKRAWVTST
ncbi:Homeobox protein tos8 [Umbelopsis nana]